MSDIPIYETQGIVIDNHNDYMYDIIMKSEKYFFIVSVIAFLSLSYIGLDNYFDISSKIYTASIVTASSTNSTSSLKLALATQRYGIPPESPINYTDNKDGTITDNYTGLIWKKCPQGMFGNDCKSGSPSIRIWSEASVECNNLNFAGKKGWRMPSLKELQSIVDSGAANPSINKKFFKGSSDPYWTDTSPAEYPVSKFTVVFSDGSVYYKDMNNFSATRCVHDGVVR